MAKVFEIPAANLSWLETKIADLSKKAAKLEKKGLANCSISLKVGEKIEKPGAKNELTGEVGPTRIFYVVEIDGTRPIVEGWEFVCALTHEAEGTLLRVVPTAEVAEGELARYRDAAPDCDHCNVRRYRKDTFVVRKVETGSLKHVGRNCLRDFLGHASPEAVAEMASLLAAAGEAAEGAGDEGWAGGRGEAVGKLSEYLAYVAAAIRVEGWLSRTTVRTNGFGCATADRALLSMWPTPFTKKEDRIEPTAEDFELADKALARMEEELEAEGKELSDYYHNLRVVVRSGVVKFKTAGIAASLMVAYKRVIAEEIKRMTWERRKADSKHVGTVGKRTVWTGLVLEAVFSVETAYGALNIHRFVDPDGNILVLKTGSLNLEEGHVYTLKATVKEHSEYKGVKNTILSRAVVMEKAALATSEPAEAAEVEA